MHRIPAIQRMLAGSNFQKLVNCSCWSKGLVQSLNFKVKCIPRIFCFISRKKLTESEPIEK